MLEEELIKLVDDVVAKRCEWQTVEVKKASCGTPTKLYDTLSSFSNQTGGGVIIFGVNENNNYEICGVYNSQDLQQKIAEQSQQMQPNIRPLCTVARIKDKTVVSAEIAECDIYDKPCFYKGAGRLRGSYIRVGEADIPMTEYEIYSFEAFKRKIEDERRIIERSTLEDLSKDNVAQYLINLRKQKPNLSSQPDETILELQGLVAKSKPTLAGVMLLGTYPQAFFPQLSITAMRVPGKEIGEVGEDDERFIDNKRIEGTIPQMLDEALNFVRRNIQNKTIIDDNGKRADKTEYPLKAVREIILNALIHRDYSIHTDNSPIRLVIYEHRLELENPGGLYGRITLDTLGKVSADTRNPFIAGALEIMINTENRFSGIPTIRKELKNANLEPPEFTNIHGIFKVIFRKQKKAKLNLEMSLEEKILSFCKAPRSREEIASEFGFNPPSYMITKYINPLIEKEFLSMTLPSKPKSKYQKYYAVKK
ncbi:MAG: putative DNA binding domain-containing protein [Firmicutes bacterium]|nr:putative DNA binding domain-containing protein [Bacillota bacterium]